MFSLKSMTKLEDLTIFERVTEGKIDSWNWVGTKYGIQSGMSYKMLIFKAFYPLPTAAVLFACWKCVGKLGSLSPTQDMTTKIVTSWIPSHCQRHRHCYESSHFLSFPFFNVSFSFSCRFLVASSFLVAPLFSYYFHIISLSFPQCVFFVYCHPLSLPCNFMV